MSMKEKLRVVIARDFGVTMTETHLTVRGDKGIMTYVLASEQDWESDNCVLCGAPCNDETLHLMEIDRGEIMQADVQVCSNCRCPQ